MVNKFRRRGKPGSVTSLYIIFDIRTVQISTLAFPDVKIWSRIYLTSFPAHHSFDRRLLLGVRTASMGLEMPGPCNDTIGASRLRDLALPAIPSRNHSIQACTLVGSGRSNNAKPTLSLVFTTRTVVHQHHTPDLLPSLSGRPGQALLATNPNLRRPLHH